MPQQIALMLSPVASPPHVSIVLKTHVHITNKHFHECVNQGPKRAVVRSRRSVTLHD